MNIRIDWIFIDKELLIVMLAVSAQCFLMPSTVLYDLFLLFIRLTSGCRLYNLKLAEQNTAQLLIILLEVTYSAHWLQPWPFPRYDEVSNRDSWEGMPLIVIVAYSGLWLSSLTAMEDPSLREPLLTIRQFVLLIICAGVRRSIFGYKPLLACFTSSSRKRVSLTVIDSLASECLMLVVHKRVHFCREWSAMRLWFWE